MNVQDEIMACILTGLCPHYGYRYVPACLKTGRPVVTIPYWTVGECVGGESAGLAWFPAFRKWRVHVVLVNRNREYYMFTKADDAAGFVVRRLWPGRNARP